MFGRFSIPLPRITVPDSEAKKKDDMSKKVAPAMLDGHSKPASCWVSALTTREARLMFNSNSLKIMSDIFDSSDI